MSPESFRIERDSLGEMRVPAAAYYVAKGIVTPAEAKLIFEQRSSAG